VNDFRLPSALQDLQIRDLDWLVIEQIWNEFKTPYEPDARLAQLSSGQRGVYGFQWLLAEVNNGGFDQYFFNSTGFLLPEAIEGVNLFEDREWIAVLETARSFFPAEYPRDRELRQQMLEDLDDDARERLDALDDVVYRLESEDSSDPGTLVRALVQRRPLDFFNPEMPSEAQADRLAGIGFAIISAPSRRDLNGATAVLAKALEIAEPGGRVRRRVESLIDQIPYL